MNKHDMLCSPGGETPHMKVVGMLVVSLRGVNFGFWSHLGCSGQNAIIFSREGLVQRCTRKKYKNIYLICIFLIRFIYSIHIIKVFSFVCVLTWSLLGVKKSCAWTTPRSVFFRGLIQNFRRASPPLSYAESPPGENLHKLTRGHSRDVREEVCRHFTTLFQTRDLIS